MFTVEDLVAKGIDLMIAKIMVDKQLKPEKQKRKGRHFGPKREKIVASVKVQVKCHSCHRKWEDVMVIQCYDDQVDAERSTFVGFCMSCIKDLYKLDNRVLVALVTMFSMSNHEVRTLPLKQKIRLAETYSAQEVFSRLNELPIK